ncbi:hypothetical protein Nepgr_009330 [Nepenthes gracilis]|uniref:Secreted protein n=1 Tax=Nepenthes gracilis TaxID=150966 RepID=A0AAD3SAE6_NEPGR|nr:hypothetical protein Nepgr_009330 [Nepenthes gracilis]
MLPRLVVMLLLVRLRLPMGFLPLADALEVRKLRAYGDSVVGYVDAQCYAVSLKGSAARLHSNSCRRLRNCLVGRLGFSVTLAESWQCSLDQFVVWCGGIALVCCDVVDVIPLTMSYSVELLSLPPKF